MENETIWELFECERGNRWSQVVYKDGRYAQNGNICYFSGCQQDHTIKFMTTTVNRLEAHEWFRNSNQKQVDK